MDSRHNSNNRYRNGIGMRETSIHHQSDAYQPQQSQARRGTSNANYRDPSPLVLPRNSKKAYRAFDLRRVSIEEISWISQRDREVIAEWVNSFEERDREYARSVAHCTAWCIEKNYQEKHTALEDYQEQRRVFTAHADWEPHTSGRPQHLKTFRAPRAILRDMAFGCDYEDSFVKDLQWKAGEAVEDDFIGLVQWPKVVYTIKMFEVEQEAVMKSVEASPGPASPVINPPSTSPNERKSHDQPPTTIEQHTPRRFDERNSSSHASAFLGQTVIGAKRPLPDGSAILDPVRKQPKKFGDVDKRPVSPKEHDLVDRTHSFGEPAPFDHGTVQELAVDHANNAPYASLDADMSNPNESLHRRWIGFYNEQHEAQAEREGWQNEYLANAKFVDTGLSMGQCPESNGTIEWKYSNPHQLAPDCMLLKDETISNDFKKLIAMGVDPRTVLGAWIPSANTVVRDDGDTWSVVEAEFDRPYNDYAKDCEIQPETPLNMDPGTFLRVSFNIQKEANQEQQLACKRADAVAIKIAQLKKEESVMERALREKRKAIRAMENSMKEHGKNERTKWTKATTRAFNEDIRERQHGRETEGSGRGQRSGALLPPQRLARGSGRFPSTQR